MVVGVLNNTGTITSGTAGYFPSKLSIDRGGTLYMAGPSEIGVAFLINYGAISGSGVINSGELLNQGTGTVSGGSLSVAGILAGFGTFDVMTGAALSLTSVYANDGTVDLNPGGLLQVTTGVSLGFGDSGSAGVFINSPDGGTVDVLGSGAAKLNGADTDLTVLLTQATTLTLSQMSFITAIGSTGNDTIVAQAANQTLTGGDGADTLIGAAATEDTFLDSAAGLNGDTIEGFAGSDVIDITDLAPGAGLSLNYTQSGSVGTLVVSEGGQSSTMILPGSFTQGDFTTRSDGSEGVLIGLHSGG